MPTRLQMDSAVPLLSPAEEEERRVVRVKFRLACSCVGFLHTDFTWVGIINRKSPESLQALWLGFIY